MGDLCLWLWKFENRKVVLAAGRKGVHPTDAGQGEESQLDLLPESGTLRQITRRVTWLSPFAKAWCATFETPVAPLGKLARFLAPLVREHGTEEVQRRWALYLELEIKAGRGQYISPTRFAETFGEWKSDGNAWRRDPTLKRPTETLDQYAARLAAQ